MENCKTKMFDTWQCKSYCNHHEHYMYRTIKQVQFNLVTLKKIIVNILKIPHNFEKQHGYLNRNGAYENMPVTRAFRLSTSR